MTYEEIIEQIKSGLTGDAEKDMAYLKEQEDKYKDHELSQEIIRACGRMMYEIMPDEAKADFTKILNAETLKISSAMDEFRFAVFNKDMKRAESIIAPLADHADNIHLFENDSVNEYFCWGEFFEEVLLKEVRKSDFQIRQSPYPYANIYLNYGSFLFELGKYKEAQEQLLKAMRWSPVNCGVRFEYMETIKQIGDVEEYGKLAAETFQYAYRVKDLARCYRNMGWYFADKQMFDEAMTCYSISCDLVKQNQAAASEMYYILTHKPDAKPMDMNEFKAVAEKYGFPIGPDKKILGLAYSIEKMFLEKEMKDGAKYCFEILYELTGDKEIKEILEKLGN